MANGDLTRAVVLAAGRGTRMSASAAERVAGVQADAASRGLKPLIPFGGAPFIAYVLTSLADAGYVDVCVVVRPGADPVRTWLEEADANSLRLHFAVQEEPQGTAHALLAAEAFVAGGDVALINADNDYPAPALAALRGMRGPGLVAFTHAGLMSGNAARERLSGYALVDVDDTGFLREIVEKPSPRQIDEREGSALFSMTCWRFSPRILDACRNIPRSARGEFELPDAVRHSMQSLGERYEVVTMDAPVLDLSLPEDIDNAAKALRGRRVSF